MLDEPPTSLGLSSLGIAHSGILQQGTLPGTSNIFPGPHLSWGHTGITWGLVENTPAWGPPRPIKW